MITFNRRSIQQLNPKKSCSDNQMKHKKFVYFFHHLLLPCFLQEQLLFIEIYIHKSIQLVYI